MEMFQVGLMFGTLMSILLQFCRKVLSKFGVLEDKIKCLSCWSCVRETIPWDRSKVL